MKNRALKANSLITLSLFSVLLFSCKDDVLSENKSEEISGSELPIKAGNIDLPGRMLASNCFQCHGTNGYAGELKIGEQSASSIISDINEMKTKDPKSNIMNAHARAYTPEEIQIIANYISKQQKY